MRVQRRIAWLGNAVVALAFAVAVGGEPRPVSFEDILSMKEVGAPSISPDGQSVLFTLSSWEETAEDGDNDDPPRFSSVGHVWRVSASGGDARQLTYGEKGETSPAWSPDGAWISFLAARQEGVSENDGEPERQIWLMRAAGGEAVRLTSADEGVNAYAWSPDASRIAFTTRDPRPEDEQGRRKSGDDADVYEGEERMDHLWVVDVASKEAVQHTSGNAFTVKGTPSWSPDGARVAFTAAPTRWLRDGRDDVHVLDLSSEHLEKITNNPGPDDQPAWSPDGEHIAFLSTPNENEPLPDGTRVRTLVNARLVLYDVAARETRDVSDGFDLIPGPPSWSPDSSRVLFTAGDRAYREMYAYDVAEDRHEKLTNGRFLTFGSLDREGRRAAFLLESSDAPSDVHVSGLDFSSPKKLTNLHPEVEELLLGETEVITWTSTEGFEVEGILMKPVGYQPGERYPLLVVAHGGPTGAHHDYFRVRYGDGGQHWAGRGWAVLYPNPRGSTNYGERFMRANQADWGGGDYRDIMAGVDAVIDMGIADPNRLAVQGWSYGGYMTCWTVSQTTRFKAAMIGAGLTNLVSMYGTNDIPNYLATFFDGTLSPETEHLYRARSGLTFADQVTTPTLILHGGNDERVPIGQPMEFFRALKDRGVPTELVFYPREGHGLREYYHRLDRMRRQYEWITRHTLGEGTGAPTSRN